MENKAVRLARLILINEPATSSTPYQGTITRYTVQEWILGIKNKKRGRKLYAEALTTMMGETTFRDMVVDLKSADPTVLQVKKSTLTVCRSRVKTLGKRQPQGLDTPVAEVLNNYDELMHNDPTYDYKNVKSMLITGVRLYLERNPPKVPVEEMEEITCKKDLKALFKKKVNPKSYKSVLNKIVPIKRQESWTTFLYNSVTSGVITEEQASAWKKF